jgi:hypothetical protein
MATEVKRYVAKDGKEFKTAADADNHDDVVFCLRQTDKQAGDLYHVLSQLFSRNIITIHPDRRATFGLY